MSIGERVDFSTEKLQSIWHAQQTQAMEFHVNATENNGQKRARVMK